MRGFMMRAALPVLALVVLTTACKKDEELQLTYPAGFQLGTAEEVSLVKFYTNVNGSVKEVPTASAALGTHEVFNQNNLTNSESVIFQKFTLESENSASIEGFALGGAPISLDQVPYTRKGNDWSFDVNVTVGNTNTTVKVTASDYNGGLAVPYHAWAWKQKSGLASTIQSTRLPQSVTLLGDPLKELKAGDTVAIMTYKLAYTSVE